MSAPPVPTVWHTSVHLRLRSVREFGLLQQISTGFASWLRYCSDVAHRRATKLHDVWPSPRLVHYIYSPGVFAPWRNFVRCRIQVTSKSCVVLYWQRHCTALQQQVSAKLCGVVQAMELRNFRRRRHFHVAAITLGIGPHSSYYYFI